MAKYLLVFLVSVCSILSIFAAPDTDAIKYPGPTESEDDDVPDECKNKTYCTIKPKNYPQEVFNELYKGYKNNPRNFVPNPVMDIPTRQGDPLDTDDCTKVVTFEPLYRVRTNTSSSWRTVVQSPKEDFIQKIRLETCYDRDVSCFKIVTSESYTTRCIQKYMTWQVLVASEHNAGKTEKILTDLPICCSCAYRPAEILSRFKPIHKN